MIDLSKIFGFCSKEEKEEVVSKLDAILLREVEKESKNKPSMRNCVYLPSAVSELVDFAEEAGVESVFSPKK